MAALSWNEIKDRALKFSKEWAHTSSEEADAKPFLDAFLMYSASHVEKSARLNTVSKNFRKQTVTSICFGKARYLSK